ncbi:MEKHLA domain-containing protein [Providencia stuartii]|uniref:MEKHLA domain-containing protein n=1 Tax=Providencia stuartii TaxID=588 RepID=UPI001121F20C|nr:MEKHLA domain-containing protein [Providencia stuartii]
MKKFPERELVVKIDTCFSYFNSSALPVPKAVEDRYYWLHKLAPFAIVAHNSEEDPHFIYANHAALTYFKYSNKEFLKLPSRLSVTIHESKERQHLLDKVKRKGIVYQYTGIRINKMNQSFLIQDGVIWQLFDLKNKTIEGLAALFYVESP